LSFFVLSRPCQTIIQDDDFEAQEGGYDDDFDDNAIAPSADKKTPKLEAVQDKTTPRLEVQDGGYDDDFEDNTNSAADVR
jgi:hypothetical protein